MNIFIIAAVASILALFTSTSAITFDCQYKEVNWLAFGLNYQCQTEPFDVESSQYVTSISGDHMPNKTIDDVIAIHISNCTNLSYIPKGLFEIFPNLLGIYLEGCGISSLNGTELNEYQALTLFALELSPLEFVPGNLFAQTPEMVLISFADNRICSTGMNLLNHLNKLEQVYFENNVCIDGNAPTVEEIPELIETLERECSNSTKCSTGAKIVQSFLIILLLSGCVHLTKYIWDN